MLRVGNSGNCSWSQSVVLTVQISVENGES